jgi:hypothetical protein
MSDRMRHRVPLLAISIFFLTGCAVTQYWVRPETGIQETARDITACRATLNQGVRPWLIEQPCMVGKGYTLSLDPPVAP